MLIDTDVHPRWKSLEELARFLAQPWRDKLLSGRLVHPHNGYPNPVATARRDAVPPTGGSAGSDPEFLVGDLINRYGMDAIVLMGESAHLALSNLANADAAAALASAYNDWLIECWFSRDARIHGSIFVATQDPLLAAREIERVGEHPQFVQVAVGSGQRFLLGQRYFYPIYAAAEKYKLPFAIHPLNEGAGIMGAPTASGYPSTYVEYHTTVTASLQAHLASMLFEGVFERFPGLRFVIVEGGVAWLPTFLWRLDKEWQALRTETPWVKRKPSEYAWDHVRLTTQPLEEPDDPKHLQQILGMFPAERVLMYSSDYPHWDFDDPTRIAEKFPEGMRRRVMYENARELYGL